MENFDIRYLGVNGAQFQNSLNHDPLLRNFWLTPLSIHIIIKNLISSPSSI